jgi:Zn finger protein HypA/HybF involved in hydrogenase expression
VSYDNELEYGIEEKIKNCTKCSRPYVAGEYIKEGMCPACSGRDTKVIRTAYNGDNRKLG